MNWFIYAPISFVPSPARDDRLNIAVVAFPEDGRSPGGVRRLRAFKTLVRALAPGVNPDSLLRAVEDIQALVAAQPRLDLPAEPAMSLDRITALRRGFRNQIQLGEPRRFQASSLATALEQLATIHLATPAKPASPAAYTRAAIKRAIQKAFDDVDLGPYRLEPQGQLKGARYRHRADFWLMNGTVDAALYALPENDDGFNALTVRDSLPTVLQDFKAVNEQFRLVAVVPPGTSAFIEETRRFLAEKQVQVASADEVAQLPGALLPHAL